MNHPIMVSQNPAPGTLFIRFRGDIQTFILSLSSPQPGQAWIRTNIGHAGITLNEIIREVEHHETPLGRDWFDIPMSRVDNKNFQVRLPLCEVGHFEAKCFFLQKNAPDPVWPKGPNCVINVEPADTCCSNIIYNAFIRQFGPNKKGTADPDLSEKAIIKKLDEKGYTVIPPSGRFRDLIQELGFIVEELGCRFIQLLPVNPAPTTYGRMGRFGSPFAALSFRAVDPALAEFDPQATPTEQFIELVDAVHTRNAKVIIDIAINHTGWAARLHQTHPEWLVRDPRGRIEVPEVWGVRWEDLTKLDYSHQELWQFMAEVFLTWCRRGVDGFRCDAGYMIPVPAWKYIVASVRKQYPDALFFLEGLGGKISVTREILNIANFNWAYSELFQNYDRRQIENYLPEAIAISKSNGLLVHFAETHDNQRLASKSNAFAKMRTALCALCSPQGAFGFANGVEWLATEKIDVHASPSLNWGSEENQVSEIRRLTTLLKTHPVFFDQTELKLIQEGPGNYIVLLRHHIPSGKRLLILANIDEKVQTPAIWDQQTAGIDATKFYDLLTDTLVEIKTSGSKSSLLLQPYQVLCLSPDYMDMNLIKGVDRTKLLFPERIRQQRMQAKALDIFQVYAGIRDIDDFNPEQAAELLAEDPAELCRRLNPDKHQPRVITWQWPTDVKREVMVPPEHFLLVRADTAFRAQISDKDRTLIQEESLPLKNGSFFALFAPLPEPVTFQSLTLSLAIYTPGKTQHKKARLLYLPAAETISIKTRYSRSELLQQPLLLLGTNGRGGMMRIPVSWGKLYSKYDAILSANLNPHIPEDRWIMFSRCRAWVDYQDYSQEISSVCLDRFRTNNDSQGYWYFHVPTGQGEHVGLTFGIKMVNEENTVRLSIYRHPAEKKENRLDDRKKIQIILRPDIESRNFHNTTKAYTGPENKFPLSVEKHSQGFSFMPEPEHCLSIETSHGMFVWEPEWHYMIHRPKEAERGFDPHSDLFSPGYFSAYLNGGESLELTAQISVTPPPPPLLLGKKPDIFYQEKTNGWKIEEALLQAIKHYIVKRGNLKTIIAGYPWFLDWGRDALIVARGLIASGRTKEARAVLKQFARFEDKGTLPNMIQGDNAGNRDTSDAPLWFFIACRDLVQYENNETFLDEVCHNRTIRQILASMAFSLTEGTPNGIRMDPESGLLFSPAHFTWMDTNHPSGTPREGYPIEMQALWFAALSFLSHIDVKGNKAKWKNAAQNVQDSIRTLFFLNDCEYLSDCLCAKAGEPAQTATPDDALRPNQLFAITLGAITDSTIRERILSACEKLLVPGAIRSLADRPLRRPLIIRHHGKTVIDPYHPYQGTYAGDEDMCRKPAYHNGTAWTWVFPSFCEAWVKTFGEEGKKTALAWLGSCAKLLNSGCVGHIPEILDGDFPHQQRGCDAQAWGASEALRVWKKLTS